MDYICLGMNEIHEQLERLRRIDLNLLPALEALVRLRSVTRSAETLGVTQSAMSHTLRRLRETLDDPLLVRGAAGMVPTPRAQSIAVPLRSALFNLAQSIDGPEPFEPGTSVRSFRLAAPDLFDALVSPRLVAILSERAPRVRLTFVPGPHDIAACLETGELDVAVVPALLDGDGMLVGGPTLAPDLRVRRLLDDSWRVFVRPEHPSLATRRLSLRALSRLAFAMVSPTGSGDGVVEPLLAREGLKRRVVLRTPNFASAIAAIRATDLALVAPGSLATHAAEFGLRELRVALELPKHRITMVWHPRFDAEPAHRWFRDLVADATLVLGAGGGRCSS
jgi:DNA-binding transcriptional LysR family regulator